MFTGNTMFAWRQYISVLGLLCQLGWNGGLVAGETVAIAKNVPRLAVLVQDDQGRPSRILSDLIFMALSHEPGVELLERQEFQSILKENELLGAVLDDAKAAALPQCGRFLGADYILFFRTETSAKGGPCLQVRLLDTRYGFKIFDRLLAVEADPAGAEVVANTLSEYTVRNVKRLSVPLKELKMIGISTFRGEGLAARWDWLGDAIPGAIEQNLSGCKGLLLMERRAVTPLLEERGIGAVVPDALQAAAVHVDGTYRVDAGARQLSITVRVRQGTQTRDEFKLTGSVDEVEELCAKVAMRLAKGEVGGDLVPSLTPARESQMLADEAKTYLRREEAARAIAPAESAYALTPNSVDCQKLLLTSLLRGGLRREAGTAKNPQGSEKTFFRAMDLAELIVRGAAPAEIMTLYDETVYWKPLAYLLTFGLDWE